MTQSSFVRFQHARECLFSVLKVRHSLLNEANNMKSPKILFLALPLLLVAGCVQEKSSLRQAEGTTNTGSSKNYEPVAMRDEGAKSEIPMMKQVGASPKLV